MPTYRVTQPDGTNKDYPFKGTIQQFVMKQWKYGVPDGHRVNEVLDAVAEVVPAAVEPEEKPAVVTKSRTRKGESK